MTPGRRDAEAPSPPFGVRRFGPLTLLAVALVTLTAATGAIAQFRVETRAVLVDVSVTRDGPVRGLRKEDFELRVAGQPRDFRLLDPESLPLAVLFAMDVSASTAGERRRRLAAGARQFAGALTELDDCGVVAFSNRARWVREFGPCGPDVGEGLLQSSGGGATALWDGIVMSLAALHWGSGRPVLLLFTDGMDNLSWAREQHIRRSVQASEVLLYSIIAPAPRASRNLRPDRSGIELLEDLVRTTGGRSVTIRSDEDLEEAFREVLRDLRVRYVLAFSPDPERRGFVPIEVRVKQRRVRVRAREGYTARP